MRSQYDEGDVVEVSEGSQMLGQLDDVLTMGSIYLAGIELSER